jgi:hypothetical protein
MTKIFTRNDARLAKLASTIDAEIAAEKATQAQVEIAAILQANPQIGVLNSGKFYTYPAGGEYREANHPADLLPASKPFWQVHWEATDIPNIARD